MSTSALFVENFAELKTLPTARGQMTDALNTDTLDTAARYVPIAQQVDTNAQTHKARPRQTLNIVLVTETWLPDINGVASSMFQIVSQLHQMGHTITLIRPEQPSDDPREAMQARKNLTVVRADLRVHSLPIPYYPHLRMGLPCYRYLSRQFKHIKPDIVHIVTEGPLGLAALLAAKRHQIKVTSGYHTSFHDFSRYFGWKVLALPLLGYMKRFHNHCAATCVPSQTTLKQLTEFGFKRLYQVGRGVDTELYNPKRRDNALRRAWGADDGTTVLLYVGRVSPEKGIDTVVKSFKALQRAQLHRHVKLVIVGDGPDKDKLSQQHAEDDSIVFAGFQTGEALARHYASGDAFIFASQVETFGNVVTEAMASGLPVFAYHDAAAALLVTEACGRTVPLGDEAAFVGMIEQLPKQQQLSQMCAVARAQVAEFSWQRPAQEMLTMFRQVLAKQQVLG